MRLDPEEQYRARRKAMTLLEHMDRTEKGLSDRLRQAGFSEEAVADAMAYVCSYGYINDKRYAGNYIAVRMEKESRRRILQSLARKGVDQETAQAAWEECMEYTEHDEQAVLRRTVEKKYEAGSRLDEKEMRRLYGYLGRRGFGYNDIAHVLEEMDIRLE